MREMEGAKAGIMVVLSRREGWGRSRRECLCDSGGIFDRPWDGWERSQRWSRPIRLGGLVHRWRGEAAFGAKEIGWPDSTDRSTGLCESLWGGRVGGILVAEGDAPLIDGEDATVGDGNAVNVASEILENSFGSLGGGFAMDDPLDIPDGRRPLDVGECLLSHLHKDPTKDSR